MYKCTLHCYVHSYKVTANLELSVAIHYQKPDI